MRVVNFLLKKEIGTLKLRYRKEERTPLHIAAIGGSEMIVLALLESMGTKKSKAQLKFIKEDSNGETAFVLACKNGNSNVVKVLLDLKCEPQADVIIDKERMYSCLHIVCSIPKKDDPDLVRLLSHAGYDLGSPVDQEVMYTFGSRRRPSRHSRVLISLGVSPDIKDGYGISFHIAASKGRLRVCKVLVKNGKSECYGQRWCISSRCSG